MNLNSLENAVLHFTAKAPVQAAIKKIFEKLRRENAYNLEALIPTRNIEIETLQYDPDWVYGDDYEILTGDFPEITDPDGQLHCDMHSSDDKEALAEIWEGKLEENAGDLQSEQDVLSAAEARRDRADPDPVLDELVDDAQKVVEKLEKREKAIKDFLWELDRLEIEYDEVYWNTMWSMWGDEPDVALCQELGLGVLERDGDHWIFLRGCGMDLSPKLIAYRAIKYQAVTESDVHKFRDYDYFQHVVGKKMFSRVVAALGVPGLFRERADGFGLERVK